MASATSVKLDQLLEVTAISTKSDTAIFYLQSFSDDAAIIPRLTCIKFIAMNLHCIASLFNECALVRVAQDQIEQSHPPPVPDDMT